MKSVNREDNGNNKSKQIAVGSRKRSTIRYVILTVFFRKASYVIHTKLTIDFMVLKFTSNYGRWALQMTRLVYT